MKKILGPQGDTKSLEAKSPIIASEFDVAANCGQTPDTVPNSSPRLAWWRCQRGHRWQQTVVARSKRGRECPQCEQEHLATQDSVAARFPQLVAQWDEPGIDPSTVRHSSNMPVGWKCDAGHQWRDSPNRRAGKGRYQGGVRLCPVCREEAARRVSLAVLRKDLADQWHPSSNGKLKPEEVAVHSTVMAWWQCPDDPAHLWQARVFWRTQGPGKCPFHSGHRLAPERSLAAMHPALVAEWSDRNGKLRPEGIAAMSDRKVWWRSRNPPHTEWLARVADRARGKGFPGDHGHMVTPENCLATVGPAVAATWLSERNGDVTARHVTAHSSRKMWWSCPTCRHAWHASVKNRVSGSGCPICNEVGLSRAEHRVMWELRYCIADIPDGRHKQPVQRMPAEGRRRTRRFREVDILLPSLGVAVEYDGVHWHAGKEEQDRIKTLELEQSGLRVIRIREAGLSLLAPNGIAVQLDAGNRQPHVVAAAVLRKLLELGCDLPLAEAYIAEGRPMRAQEAERAWVAKMTFALKRSKRKA